MLTRRHLATDAGRALVDEGLEAFAAAVPGGKDARDVIEHFDEYTQGIGRLRQSKVGRQRPQPDEAQAERFCIDFRWDGEGEQRHPVLVVGPYLIDLVTATEAAARLQCDTYEALRADEGNPVPRGWAYAVQHGTHA